jgi:peptide/nickel transport system ATP-binding protein
MGGLMNNNEHEVETPVLELRHVGVEYVSAFQRTRAVRDLSLKIGQGEVYGLVGESGCGKSTAALACVRYLPAGTVLSGEVRLMGQDLLSLDERALREVRGNRVAMVYQDPQAALNPALTIGSQLVEVLTAHGKVTQADAEARCREALDRVRIPDPALIMRRFPHQLSGGMQQRVVIAMALLLKPNLLIMDEPTTGLDVTIEAAVLDLVNDLRTELKAAILFISHNMGVIARLCDRVGVMYAGEMVEEAPVRDLFRAPRHPYTMGLLRCIPRQNNSKGGNALWSIPGRVPPLHSLPSTCVFQARCAMARSECSHWRPVLEEVDAAHHSRCLFWKELESGAPGGPALGGEAADLQDLLPAKNQAPASGTRLQVDDLKVYYQISGGLFSSGLSRQTVRAVDGVSFCVPEHSTLGIVGESGCGKSTIARAIAGLAPTTGGKLDFGGEDLTRPVKKRSAKVLQMLQMVFQNPDSTLNPQKTVEDELRRPLRLFHIVPRKDEDQVISQLLVAVNLDDSYRQRYPMQLSGGEKQRVAIARAFAERPQLVLCDEPASSLDVSVQSMVLNLLLRLQHEFGVSLIFISHDLGVVRYVSDFVAVVYLGKICEIGRVDQIFQPPYHPYTEALLSAVPVPDPTVQRTRIQLTGNLPSPVNPPSGCPFHTRCPRKLGAICEEQTPAPTEMDGHLIYCHIARQDLLESQAGSQVGG